MPEQVTSKWDINQTGKKFITSEHIMYVQKRGGQRPARVTHAPHRASYVARKNFLSSQSSYINKRKVQLPFTKKIFLQNNWQKTHQLYY